MMKQKQRIVDIGYLGYQRQAGFTLIEIMIGLVLGLLLLNAVIQVFLSTQQSARIQQSASRMQEDGRIAMTILNRYIRLAGYQSYPWNKADTGWNPALNERGFAAVAPWLEGQVILGTDGSGANPDSIRIRYQGSNDPAIATCLGAAIPPVNPATPNIPGIADIILDLSAPAPDGARSLSCRVAVNGGAFTARAPMVGGLENMQITYGLSQGAGGVDSIGRLTGGANLTYVTANNVAANGGWDRVIAVRIELVVRSDQDNLTLDSRQYMLNGVPVNPGDRRMRYVMGTTVNIRNKVR
ncbi:MAG: hypothetical protein CSA09_00475 [Candidatus Contendobacter odensis]|uniref:Prepilin-type cleavage/methylation domain-containing protein n=1 Tax=Candidatus Contendibacter odensensis TaxID=1400860 RepID=A0A2G6PGT5_9GAMM|nr:MAG: hypothetical protein CSA09_00475 [Candidatus Contendobacter odensis]